MLDRDDYILQTKFFLSTKIDILTNKVNKWLEENSETIFSPEIKPFMSYTTIKDKGACMIGCMVDYYIKKEKDNEDFQNRA